MNLNQMFFFFWTSQVEDLGEVSVRYHYIICLPF